MGVPYGMDYTTTTRGSMLKLAACEQCQAEYVYRLERMATGTGSSLLFVDNEGARNRSASRAERRLNQILDRAVDPVPCPACGWYQKAMVAKARRLHRRWMLQLGGGLLVGLIPIGLIAVAINSGTEHRNGVPLITWTLLVGIFATLALMCLGLMIGKVVLARGYDPNNQDVEARKQLGKARATLRADLERLAQQDHKPQAGDDPQPEPKPE
jgi:hypothetical protein